VSTKRLHVQIVASARCPGSSAFTPGDTLQVAGLGFFWEIMKLFAVLNP
jgi:hypothetical protein